MSKVRVKLLLHGSFRQHDGGTHESIAAAKRHLKEINWSRPHSIIRLQPPKQD